MKSFVYAGAPGRVVFGAHAFTSLPDEVLRLGAHRALVLSTAEQSALAESASAMLGTLSAGVHARAIMHVPMVVAKAGREEAVRTRADALVAVGGGSTTGLAKAIAMETGLPIVAVPTTYAGSEVTPIWGITDNGAKITGRDGRALPRAVIYDPLLTVGLPRRMSLTSGLNAMAHAAEALYAPDGNPISSMMAEEGLRAMASALPRLNADPHDLEARGEALYAAWLCGTVLGSVSVGLHHKLCHTLGGSFDLPHAELHGVVLPHALAYNASHAPEAVARVARALHVPDASRALFDMLLGLKLPHSLRELGMPEDGLDGAADLAVSNAYPNPRPLDRDAIRALLDRCYLGQAPRP